MTSLATRKLNLSAGAHHRRPRGLKRVPTRHRLLSTWYSPTERESSGRAVGSIAAKLTQPARQWGRV